MKMRQDALARAGIDSAKHRPYKPRTFGTAHDTCVAVFRAVYPTLLLKSKPKKGRTPRY